MHSIFEQIGIPQNPVLLAPLAGVSDHPFRIVCQENGADLTYVEMLSATALVYGSKRTFDMLFRHADETKLGVQITARTPEDMAKAVAILDKYPFETIDINMGCPVKKVTKSGSGSAILKDPTRVANTIRAARENTDKPVSVKVRLGWDSQTVTIREVAEVAEREKAVWLTLHGRLRNDTYATPVNLEMMAQTKEQISIPFIGNGNIFTSEDARLMTDVTGCDGLMVSRGAMGNPWVFREIKTGEASVSLDDWLATIERHLRLQQKAYGDTGMGAICMRKHLLWYLKGWPGAKRLREELNLLNNIESAFALMTDFAENLRKQGVETRDPVGGAHPESRFQWDPKFEMDRKLDRGVGDFIPEDAGRASIEPII